MAIDIGQGTFVGFGTALHTATGYKITGVNHGGISRAVADATHMQSTAKEFIGSAIYDPGELSVEVLFDPETKRKPDEANLNPDCFQNQRLENCLRRLALCRPTFLRSTSRASRVTSPAADRLGFREAS